jgi:hypothetical protein
MIGETTEAVGAGVGGGSSGNKMPTLEEYGTNLTKLAEEVMPMFYSAVISTSSGLILYPDNHCRES